MLHGAVLYPPDSPQTCWMVSTVEHDCCTSQCYTWEHETTPPAFLARPHCAIVQVATELIVGFPKSFINKEMLARQKQLWGDWLDGFLALPINLPGFGMQSCIMPAWMCACMHTSSVHMQTCLVTNM